MIWAGQVRVHLSMNTCSSLWPESVGVSAQPFSPSVPECLSPSHLEHWTQVYTSKSLLYFTVLHKQPMFMFLSSDLGSFWNINKTNKTLLLVWTLSIHTIVIVFSVTQLPKTLHHPLPPHTFSYWNHSKIKMFSSFTTFFQSHPITTFFKSFLLFTFLKKYFTLFTFFLIKMNGAALPQPL